MSEYVRSIRVEVEVDTNKATYRTVIAAESADDAGRRVAEFIEVATQ